jgi:hypothetical protein
MRPRRSIDVTSTSDDDAYIDSGGASACCSHTRGTQNEARLEAWRRWAVDQNCPRWRARWDRN